MMSLPVFVNLGKRISGFWQLYACFELKAEKDFHIQDTSCKMFTVVSMNRIMIHDISCKLFIRMEFTYDTKIAYHTS